MKHIFLAFDLGASSGRAISGTLENDKLTLKEVHRFHNQMLCLHGSYYWNVFNLYEDIVTGLKACSEWNLPPESAAIDTWGVDFALLDKQGKLLGMPYAYRDHRTDKILEQFFRLMPREKIFELTGIAFWPFNSLYQLYAWKRDQPDVLSIADKILFMPDIFNYFLTGQKRTEFTFATTSQMYHPGKANWEPHFFKVLDIPESLMCEVIQPGTVIGGLTDQVAEATGLNKTLVTAVASHDTGSAIAAIPAEGSDWAYISSGTWSLMGMEIDEPIISESALKYNFTNEGGVGKTYRFLKNIMGLWLIQECRRIWAQEGTVYSYADMVGLAARANPCCVFIDPEWMGFFNPDHMPDAITGYLEKSGQRHDLDHGEIIRCIIDSLAMQYRKVLDQLSEVSGRIVTKLHIIGGGIQNELLCQLTANATGIPVITGPAEATASGNLMVQAMARGYVNSLEEVRQVIRNSFDLKTYYPQQVDAWEHAYNRFLELNYVNTHLK